MCAEASGRKMARGWGVSSERRNNEWSSAGLLTRLADSGLPVLVISTVAT